MGLFPALGWFVVSLVLVPGLVLIHELGHALAVVLLTGQRTLVTVGSGERYAGLRLGRVRIWLSRDYETGSCAIPPGATPRDVFVIALAGPAASVVAAIGLAVAFITVGRPVMPYVILGIGTLVALAFSLGNLVPRYSADQASDGWHALAAWTLFRGTPEWRMPVEQILARDDPPTACHTLLEATVREARILNSPYIGTEHLLIAIAGSEGEAGEVLRSAGLSGGRLRTALGSEQERVHADVLPSTPAIKRVCQGAESQLTLRGDQEVGPEHLLLALLQEKSGRALELVHAFGSSPDALRPALVRAMGARASSATRTTSPVKAILAGWRSSAPAGRPGRGGTTQTGTETRLGAASHDLTARASAPFPGERF